MTDRHPFRAVIRSSVTSARWPALVLGWALLVGATAAPAVAVPPPLDLGPGLVSRPAGPDPAQLSQNRNIVVKVDRAAGAAIEDVVSAFPVRVVREVLASHGIYLVEPTDPGLRGDWRIARLAERIGRAAGVVYAEPDETVELTGSQFHGWPDGTPWGSGTDPADYQTQFLSAPLRLGVVHQQAVGAGVRVAVLDTGADLDHPALAGRVHGRWNYIDDSPDVDDVATGLDDDGDGTADSAVGHGTFVAGLVAAVAPQAEIDAYTVLNSDGYGSYYEVAQAIMDATADHADVISLSFGTSTRSKSRVLQEAVDRAERAGVLIVAAAGNRHANRPEYPAAEPGVLSVSALDRTCSALAWFAGWGDWADVAAPGQDVVGPLPGGRYARWSGTSMSTPIVAGQAALVLGATPGLRSDGAFRAITETADPLPRRVLRFGSVDIGGSLAWRERRPGPR